MKDIVSVFNDYVANFDLNDKSITLKKEHSIAVMDLMGELAFRLGLPSDDISLARLIGLLHDIGRFPQWTKYKTFEDSKSIDHAEASADYLFKEGHIRDFIENNEYDSIIEKAIRNHNKFEIEKGLSERELLFSKMIRDTDKIDIFKQMAIKYNIEFNANEVTTEVLEAFKNENMILNVSAKTKTDTNLRTLAFIFDINFNESYDLLVETDNFDLYLSVVDVSEDSEKLWKKIKEICFDKINRGVE